MFSKFNLKKLITAAFAIANQKSLSRKQREILNESALGKAVIARWLFLKKNYRLAARRFLNAYDSSKQPGFLFEAAYALMMVHKDFGKSSEDSFSYKIKKNLNRDRKQSVSLLLEAASFGHDQACACVLCMYMDDDLSEIDRKVFFQGLKAASEGFVDERLVQHRGLMFSLMPSRSEIKMLKRESAKEIGQIVSMLSYDRMIELNSSESEILSNAFYENRILDYKKIDSGKSQNILNKVLNVFDHA